MNGSHVTSTNGTNGNSLSGTEARNHEMTSCITRQSPIPPQAVPHDSSPPDAIRNCWRPAVISSPVAANHPSNQPAPHPKAGVEPNKYRTPNIERKLPALAKVVQARVPSAYDKTALRLQVSISLS